MSDMSWSMGLGAPSSLNSRRRPSWASYSAGGVLPPEAVCFCASLHCCYCYMCKMHTGF